MPEVKCAFLGYPQIRVNNEIAGDFISTKSLLLACYLILNPQKVHAREVLATYFWEEMPTQRAKSNLRQALHNIQKLMPDCFDVTRQSVQVVPSHFEIDTVCLQDITEQENPSEEILLKGIDLYRGEFLEGLYVDESPEIETWLRYQRERLRIAFLDILEVLSTHYLQKGQWESAEKIYRRSLDIEPWQENSHRQLMLCLARQQKYEAALAQYEICSQILEGELGVEPMIETIQLYRRIKQARVKPRRALLPQEPYPFIGRQADIACLRPWMLATSPRLITILGEGGIGKTRLAVQIAYLFGSNFINHALHIPLLAYSQISVAIADTLINLRLMSPLTGNQDIEDYLIDYLQDVEMLLLLDNAEHLVEQAPFVQRVLENAPHIKIIVTSRIPLELRWEQILRLDGLLYPETTATPDWKRYDAVRLFVETAQRINHEFVIDISNAVHVVKICQIVTGIPLALELAAFSASRLDCQLVAEQIQNNIDTLSTTMRDIPPRQRSIRATFDYSWTLLSDIERNTLINISIFRGRFTQAAAEQIANVANPVLEALVKKSFVRFDDHRYAVHELLRQYCAVMLSDIPRQYQKICENYAHYYLSLLSDHQESILAGIEALDVVRLIEDGLPNIRAAWFWAIEHEDEIGVMLGAVKTLSHFYQIRGRTNEAFRFFSDTLDMINEDTIIQDSIGCVLLSRIYAELAMNSYYVRELEIARNSAQRSLELAYQAESNTAIMFAVQAESALEFQQGNYDEGLKKLKSIYELAMDQGDSLSAAMFLSNQGAILYRQGKYDEAFVIYQQSLTLIQESRNVHRIPVPLMSIGYIQKERNNYSAAEQAYQECLNVHEQFDNKRGLVDIYFRLGILYFDYEDYEQAIYYYKQCIELGYQIRKFLEVVYALSGLYHTSLELDKEASARRYLKEAFQLCEEIDSTYAMLFLFRSLIRGLKATRQIEVAFAAGLLTIYHPRTPPAAQIKDLLDEIVLPLVDNPSPNWGNDRIRDFAFVESQLEAMAKFVDISPRIFRNLYDAAQSNGMT